MNLVVMNRVIKKKKTAPAKTEAEILETYQYDV